MNMTNADTARRLRSFLRNIFMVQRRGSDWCPWRIEIAFPATHTYPA